MPSLGKAGVKGHEGRPFLPPAAKRTRRPRININLKSPDVSQTAIHPGAFKQLFCGFNIATSWISRALAVTRA